MNRNIVARATKGGGKTIDTSIILLFCESYRMLFLFITVFIIAIQLGQGEKEKNIQEQLRVYAAMLLH